MVIIPLSLYIHFPWCLSKCPYCDFNSEPLANRANIAIYVARLLDDLEFSSSTWRGKKLVSIYFGGGTPSLLSPQEVALVIERIKKYFSFVKNIEITLEVNPRTIDLGLYREFKDGGVNRISLGVQSFDDACLNRIKRRHNSKQAQEAIAAAKLAGFTNLNCDLMFGLPEQNITKAIEDLRIALSFKPTHISWYQLTLEPNSELTVPEEDEIWRMQWLGQDFLSQNGFKQYEVSVYSQSQMMRSQHNMNYWQYGDYLGIGSGAYSKLTFDNFLIKRYIKISDPIRYIYAKDFVEECEIVPIKKLPLEFMLNALRLYQPITYDLFYKRTGLTIDTIKKRLQSAENLGLIKLQNNAIITTSRGKNFLNDLLEIFL